MFDLFNLVNIDEGLIVILWSCVLRYRYLKCMPSILGLRCWSLTLSSSFMVWQSSAVILFTWKKKRKKKRFTSLSQSCLSLLSKILYHVNALSSRFCLYRILYVVSSCYTVSLLLLLLVSYSCYPAHMPTQSNLAALGKLEPLSVPSGFRKQALACECLLRYASLLFRWEPGYCCPDQSAHKISLDNTVLVNYDPNIKIKVPQL